jgi:nucleotidyltransferase-like protein
MAVPLSLLASSGNEQLDQITRGVIEALELHFPDRIRGYYFEGSCADGAITPLSDIDLAVVFKDQQTAIEQQHFTALMAACKRISPRNLDVSCIDETTLRQANRLQFQPDWSPVLGAITLKCASVPVYGADIRHTVPFVPHDVYTRTLMHFPYLVLAGQRKHPPQLPYPLDYLEPDDEFFGYTGRLLRAPDGTLTPSTKRIVHASGYIATALLALRTPIFVADKRTAISAYRQHIDDAWAEHLERVHHYCRMQWGYCVPEAPADRAILRQLCQRELAFENDFLAIYKDYLAQEQDADDPVARQFARERMQRISQRIGNG